MNKLILPRLANIKKKERYHIYIGRANGWLGLEHSKWHNPFVLEKESERGSTLEKFREYFLKQQDLIDALPELSGKILGCYCFSSDTNSGSPCHGGVLIEMFQKFVIDKQKDEILNTYKWIKVLKYVDDETLSWEERYKKLEAHHIEETKFLIDKVRELL